MARNADVEEAFFPPAIYSGKVRSRPLPLRLKGSAEPAVAAVTTRAGMARGYPPAPGEAGAGGSGCRPPRAQPPARTPYIGVLVGGDGDELSFGESERLHAAGLAGVLCAVLVHFHHMQAGLVLVQGL